MGLISVKGKLGIPKYKQIVTSIEKAIVNGSIRKGDKLPSLNSIKNKHSLSRDTVLMAFNELKVRGIIQSIVGKGYYLMSEDIFVNKKIFLLFDELNSFKEDLYNAFLGGLESNVQVDIFFHHFNFEVFSKLIHDNNGDYSYYVIMPANLSSTSHIIEKLPKDKVYILDQTHKDLSIYPSIYQNFGKDIYNGLSQGYAKIKNYQKLVLFFSDIKQPEGILQGFKLFCSKYSIASEVFQSVDGIKLEKGVVYIVLDDRDLIKIIKKLKETKFILAKDIGVISYNETILTEIVECGITTISTDFNLMGKRLAEMIMNNETVQIENPNNFILRNSL
jgi:DNA-binding transcriptional regulator YhcF (GntR family)